MARILVELYSGRTPENLISLLKERFDRICFFSFSEKVFPSEKEKKELCAVIRHLLGFDPEFFTIAPSSVEEALKTFFSLYREEDEYEIDITGGDEVFVAAAGIFSAKVKEGTVFLHQYDIKSGKKLFRYPAARKEDSFFPHHLSAPQILRLNGTAPITAPAYSFTVGTLKAEVLRLWECVKKNPKEWNRFCSMSADGEGGKPAMMQKCLGGKGSRSQAYDVIARKLKDAGIMSNERRVTIRHRDYMEFSLNVPKEARFLYDKAGNLLEMYAALAASESGIFHDIRVGVTLDWNGIVAAPRTPDPKNEVDLILMHENLPILASCKNAIPQNEYLYEIMIMAKHYGGYFATPMLLTSGRGSPTVRMRAKEMGILLIDGIRYLSSDALSGIFLKHFEK